MADTIEKDFNAAVAYVRGLPKGKSPISTSKQLDFYSRFKQVILLGYVYNRFLIMQATIGTCAEHGGSQPWAVQVEARAKWDAWKKLGDMSKDEAMKVSPLLVGIHCQVLF